MSTQKESIFASALRSFVRSMFTVFGVFLGLVPVLIVLGGASNSPLIQWRPRTLVHVAPDANDERQALQKGTPLVLQIDIHGVIGDEVLNAALIDAMLQESQEDPIGKNRIKALLLHLNTPGGTTTDSDAIYRLVKRYKSKYKIPVYAYVDGICASGGLYIAAAADKVYASQTSLVGSVGVLIPPFFNISEAMEKWGISAKTIIAGKGKDALNPTRPWTEGEGKDLEETVQYLYQRFIEILVESRSLLSRDALMEKMGARVLPAPQALTFGFIDAVEDYQQAVLQDLVVEAGIEQENYQVIRLESRHWLSHIFSSSNPLWRGKLKHEVQLIPGMDSRLSHHFLYLYHPHNSAYTSLVP